MNGRTAFHDVNQHCQAEHPARSEISDGIVLLKSQSIHPIPMRHGGQSPLVYQGVDRAFFARFVLLRTAAGGVPSPFERHDGAAEPQSGDEIVVRYDHFFGLFDASLPPRHVQNGLLRDGPLVLPTQPQPRPALRMQQLTKHQHLTRRRLVRQRILPRDAVRYRLGDGFGHAGELRGEGVDLFVVNAIAVDAVDAVDARGVV
mmetsp:Transcript_40141/g.84009  ORF Transcript_40141/g.84009 Transcript_40141/m.84009 type:complete len:202 (-) Transcript_40141:585-1190(-)